MKSEPDRPVEGHAASCFLRASAKSRLAGPSEHPASDQAECSADGLPFFDDSGDPVEGMESELDWEDDPWLDSHHESMPSREEVVEPKSDESWINFAATNITLSESKKLQSWLPWDRKGQQFLGVSLSDSLNAFLSIPSSSLQILSEPRSVDPETQSSKEIRERLISARKVRVARSDDDLRDASIGKIQKIILIDPEATRLGELLVPKFSRPLDDREIKRSIEQAFSRKSSGTLYKRACALSRYVDWYHRLNRMGSPLRLKEFDMYRYLNHLDSEKAGATAATGFIEALRFLDGIAIFTMASLDVALSPRVTGFAHQMFLQKEPLKQKDPLMCCIVAELERLLLRKQDAVQICILGQLLWCFHSASRWSDAQRLQSLKLEKSDGVTLIVGEALGSKTSLTKEAKTRLLPYVGIGTGISGCDWSEPWLDARVSELGRDPDPFLPSFSLKSGRWSSNPMSSTEACSYLHDFVSESMSTMDPKPKVLLENLGTHSLKTGLLTMAARSTSVKFSLSERRTLGHHIKPGDKSVLTYSREAYTSLYGKVLACFLDIQTGVFNPDASALQRIVETAGAWRAGVPPDVPEAPTAHEEEAVEVSSDSSEEQVDLVQLLDLNDPVVHRSPFPQYQDMECVVHKKSGIVHCLRDETRTFCRRFVSSNYVALDRASIEDMECCILCGRQLASEFS